MFQSVQVIGRVGKDLEWKGKVGKFSIAASRTYVSNGEKVEKTTWFNCSLFGKLAEGVGQYVLKGTLVHVEGIIETTEYNGKYYWGLNVNKLTLLGKKEGQKQTEQSQQDPALDNIPF